MAHRHVHDAQDVEARARVGAAARRRPRGDPPASPRPPSPRPPVEPLARHASGALPRLRRRLPGVLRPAPLGLPLRDGARARSGRGASARDPDVDRRPRPRDAPRGRRRRAAPARLRRRLLLGLRAPLHRPRRGSTGTSSRPSACRPRYHGVWDAAQGRLPPDGGRLLRVGEVLGRRPHVLRRLHRRLGRGASFLLRRDRFPFWKAADMAGFADPARPRLRSHGLPARRAAASASTCELPWALVVPAGTAPRARRSSRRTLLASARDVVAAACTRRRSTSRPLSLAIAAFCLLWVHGRKRYDGQVFVAFLALYAVGALRARVPARRRPRRRCSASRRRSSSASGSSAVALAIHVLRSRRPGREARAAA